METDIRSEYALQDLLVDEDLIFVYAWADWNLYCRHHLNRTYKRIADSLKDFARFTSINVDQMPVFANRVLQVRYVPAIIIVTRGEKRAHVNVMQSDNMLRIIQDAIDGIF